MTLEEQEKIVTWQELANTYIESREHKQGLEYFQGLLLNDKLSEIVRSYIYNILGYITLKSRDYKQALKYREQALSIRKNIGIDYYICESLNDIGVIYYYIGEYEKSKQYYVQSLGFVDMDNLREEFGILYCNLGYLFYKLFDFDNCEFFFNKAIDIYNKFSIQERLSEAYYNLGIVLYSAQKADEALEAFHKSFIAYKNLGVKYMPALCEKMIADIYFEGHKYDKAQIYYKSSLDNDLYKVDAESYYDAEYKIKEIQKRF